MTRSFVAKRTRPIQREGVLYTLRRHLDEASSQVGMQRHWNEGAICFILGTRLRPIMLSKRGAKPGPLAFTGCGKPLQGVLNDRSEGTLVDIADETMQFIETFSARRMEPTPAPR